MICKLCEKSDDFGKSHIIPKSFFLNGGTTDEVLIVAYSKGGEFPKRRRIGEFDKEILCKECEKKFDAWDDYAKLLLIDEIDNFHEIKNEEGEIIALSRDSFDYKKIKLFFISVLWRAGVSKRQFFEKVSLGPHEDTLREMILARDPGDKETYLVQPYRFNAMPDGIPIIMPIHIRSSYGFQYYRIYLGRIFYDVKVDSRKTPKKYSLGGIEKGKPLLIPNSDIKEMDEYNILKQVANAPQNATVI